MYLVAFLWIRLQFLPNRKFESNANILLIYSEIDLCCCCCYDWCYCCLWIHIIVANCLYILLLFSVACRSAKGKHKLFALCEKRTAEQKNYKQCLFNHFLTVLWRTLNAEKPVRSNKASYRLKAERTKRPNKTDLPEWVK